MTTTHKAKKAAQLTECFIAVAKHLNVDPMRVKTALAPKSRDIQKARLLLWSHMHRCGMSYEAIGRQFGNLTREHVRDFILRKSSSITLADRDLLSSLPKIETTLVIARVA